MTPQAAITYIRENLSNKPLTYQLGFLQGFLAMQMTSRMEVAQDFRNQIRSTQSPSDQSSPTDTKTPE